MRHRYCFDPATEPKWQESEEEWEKSVRRTQEREEAIEEYLNGVLTANEFWVDDINEDADVLASCFLMNPEKAYREADREAIRWFLYFVRCGLREHRVKQLNPLTRFRMGIRDVGVIVTENLSQDEATKEVQRMREQGFAVYQFQTDSFPAVYSVLGYRPQGSEQPTGAHNNAPSGTNAAGRGNDAPTPDKTPTGAQEARNNAPSGTNAAGMGNDAAAPSGTPTGAQEARNNAPSGTNAAGRGDDAPAPDKTPTGAQEARKKPKKQGRPPKEFDEYFNDPSEAATFIPILTRLLNGKKAKDAARIIIAFYEGGWTIERPSLSSIERRFNLEHSSDISDRIRCHYNHKKMQAPEYKPFPPEELNPIIVAIKREIAKQQPPQNTEK